MKRYSHDGFWAVARAAGRLRRARWWLRGIDVSVRRLIRVGGIRWQLRQAIYVNETGHRRVKYVFLWPPSVVTPAARRGWRQSGHEARIIRRLKVLGYRRRPTNPRNRGLSFEKVLDVGATSEEWDQILRSFSGDAELHPIPQGRRSRDVIRHLLDELPALIRKGWQPYHLDLLSPVRRFQVGGFRWTLNFDIHWFAREGISIGIQLESQKGVGRDGLRALQKLGFFDRAFRDLGKRGLRSVSGPRLGSRSASLWMYVGRSLMRPNRAIAILNRVKNWVPTK